MWAKIFRRKMRETNKEIWNYQCSLSNLYRYSSYNICKFLGNVDEERRRFFEERRGKRIEKFGIINALFRIFIVIPIIFVNFWKMWVKRDEDLSKKDEGNE